MIAVLLILSCRPAVSEVQFETGEAQAEAGQGSDSGSEVEQVPGWIDCDADDLFSDSEVHHFSLILSEGAIGSLADDPGTYVEASLGWGDRIFEPVGVRLKGNSTWQWIDQKPALKIKLDAFFDGWEVCGRTRLTLNNNVYDTSMMAETLAYAAFRAAGSPAPRTGYATVSLNGDQLGLYTLVEAMDGDFVEANWPGSEGGLWEMTRNCDFTDACDCFDLDWSGDDFDAGALDRACEAVSEGTAVSILETFDREALLAFLAMEVVVNIPDSYSYNLNNWHMYHDPISDRISLSPWGADSAMLYYYPPSGDHPCEVWEQNDAFTDTVYGQLTIACRADAACWDAMRTAIADGADVFEALDMPSRVNETAERIRYLVHTEPRIEWPYQYFEHTVSCLDTWSAARPAQVRDWLAE